MIPSSISVSVFLVGSFFLGNASLFCIYRVRFLYERLNLDCLFSLPVYEIADFFFPFESFRAAACFLTILDLSPWLLAINYFIWFLRSNHACVVGFCMRLIVMTPTGSVGTQASNILATRSHGRGGFVLSHHLSSQSRPDQKFFWKSVALFNWCGFSIFRKLMERGTGFEPVHPRVEALVHSLFYVTPACVICLSIL